MSNVLSELNDRWMVFLGWEAAFLLTQRAQCSYWPRGSSVLTGPEGPVFLLTQRVQCSYWPRGLYSIPCTNHWQQVKLYREKLHLLKLLEALPSEPKIKTLYPIYLTQWPICFFSPLVSHISKSLLIFSPNVNALFRLIINSLSLLLYLFLGDESWGAVSGVALAVMNYGPLGRRRPVCCLQQMLLFCQNNLVGNFHELH